MRRVQPRSSSSVPILATVLLAFTLPVLAQPDFDAVEIKSTEIAPGIYMLEGLGGNIGVSAGPDGAFLIDDQFAPLTDKIRAAVAGLTDQPLRFVINTHWHGDHTGGNENLGQAGVLIVAHENVRKRMSAEHFSTVFNSTTPPSPKAALPVVTFTDDVTFHLNGEEIHAFHLPTAHTDGDSIIHFRNANVIHMGDVFFNGMYPFIDVESGGSVDGLLDAVEHVLRHIDGETKIIPGHGPLTDRDGLLAYRDMLYKVRWRVAPMVEAGKSLAEVVAAKPTAEYDAALGEGFFNADQFVGFIYSSLEHE